MEAERLAAIERHKEMEQKRLDNELQLRDILKRQMAELKEREKEVCEAKHKIPACLNL